MSAAGRKYGGSRNQRVDMDGFFDRMNTTVDSRFTHDGMPGWIERHTSYRGEPFSFVDHEYQLEILKSEKEHKVIKKSSQLGISEVMVRAALAYCYQIPYFSVIFTEPTTDMARNFSRTRIDPVIAESATLSSAVVGQIDSVELKQIASSYFYTRGTWNSKAGISVPADMLIHDEVDFSDQDALTTFQSRLTHSKYKWTTKISTPTLPKFGIDESFQASNRHFCFVVCNHCNHDFIPDYRKHVVVPGYDGNILAINKAKLPFTRWREAYLACPKCGRTPDLFPKHRRWVVENNDEMHPADGFQISPFDAPAFQSVQTLMLARTGYKRQVDFVNFGLGQVDEDELSGIQEIDLDRMELVFIDGLVGTVLGIDMGTTVHCVEARIDAGDALMITGLHSWDYRDHDRKLDEMYAKHRPIATVEDAQPYIETVYRNQQKHRNLYASVYVNAQGVRPYRLMDDEEDKTEAMFDERQINTNRNVALDYLMEDIRAGRVGLDPELPEPARKEFRAHLRDMRRVRTEAPGRTPDTERFTWVKSKQEVDHFHHALLYAWLAKKLRLAARPLVTVSPLQVMGRLRMKNPL